MKNYLILSILVISSLAFTTSDAERLAQVNREEGLYLFVDSRPVQSYEILGYVRKVTGWINEYDGVKAGLIRKAQRNFPESDALIIDFNTWGHNIAEVIRFTGEEGGAHLGRALEQQGILVFTGSYPLQDYRTLGRVTKHWSWTREYEEIRDGLIKKARRAYPEAEAVLLKARNGVVYEAEVIAFK
jgi:hypothetical protein